MRSRRGALAAGVALLSVPVILASLAWACSPARFASINGSTKVVVPVGATVTVTGTRWEILDDVNNSDIRLVWVENDRVLATLRPLNEVYREAYDNNQGRPLRSFEQTVKLPETMKPGVTYELRVVGPPSPGSTVEYEWPITVVTAGERVVDPIRPGDGDAPTPPPTAPGAKTVTTTPAAPAAAAPVAEDTSVFEPADAPAASAVPGRAAPDRSPALAAGRTRTAAAAAAVAPPATPGATAAGSGTAAPQPAVATEVAPGEPGARTVGADLWSGFATGTDQRGASLAGDSTAPGSSSNSMGTGLAILGVGLVALLAGLGIALRRRPVKVVSTD